VYPGDPLLDLGCEPRLAGVGGSDESADVPVTIAVLETKIVQYRCDSHLYIGVTNDHRFIRLRIVSSSRALCQ
jgi:hypothetical protein